MAEKPDEARGSSAAEVAEIAGRKMDLIAQVRELQSQMARLNVELVQRGADPQIVASW